MNGWHVPAAPILPFIHSGAVLATNWREPGLVHVERHVHDAAVNAFDGAGKPYKGPSYKGGIASAY